MMLEPRELWSTAPPEPRTRLGNWPTVLFSWWCTSFAAMIILTRVLGRKARSNKLFREDWIMLIALIPLFIRMIFIHFVLTHGTNNVDTTSYEYTEHQIYLRTIGSRLVLPARIFYAMFIWISKLTLSEFLKRITFRIWKRQYQAALQGIRIFLFITFAAVVLATLTECRPFHAYWQVVPDPGPRCRQGYAQLFTMGAADIITDILLIAFPIPVVLASGQNWKRKFQMGILFSMSSIMIAVTLTRIPNVIAKQGRQQYRTVWASAEILASAAVSNGVILGSFLRDKGTKKNKYRSQSVAESTAGCSARRATLTRLQPHGSDEDLFFEMGCRVPEHLRDTTVASPRPAPPALPASKTHIAIARRIDTPLDRSRRSSDEQPSPGHHVPSDLMSVPKLFGVLPSPATTTDASDGYFDFSHHGDEQEFRKHSRQKTVTESEKEEGGGVAAQDFVIRPGSEQSSGSRMILRDLGGILATNLHLPPDRDSNSAPLRRDDRRSGDRLQTAPMPDRQVGNVALHDPGGLLQPNSAPLQPIGTSHLALGVDWRIAGRRESLNQHPPASQQRADEIELEDIGNLLSDDIQHIATSRTRSNTGSCPVDAIRPVHQHTSLDGWK